MKANLALGAAACALGLVFTTGPARAQPRPDLSGTWRLNEKESDNPRERLRESFHRGGRGGGFPGGGGGRGGGFPGGGRRGGFGGREGGPGGGPEGGPGAGGPGEDAGGPGRFERMQEHYRTLQIRHVEPALEVEYGDQRGETFYTDGRKVKRDTGERGLVEVQAKWKDRRVVVERETGRGKATETFELAQGGQRLIVISKLNGPRGSMTIKRVYDPDASEAAPPAEPPSPPSDGR